MRVRIKASPERIAELQQSLAERCESVEEDIDCDADNAEEFGGLITFYPIDQRLR